MLIKPKVFLSFFIKAANRTAEEIRIKQERRSFNRNTDANMRKMT